MFALKGCDELNPWHVSLQVTTRDLQIMDSTTAVQSQKALSAYFSSKQILPFGFAEQYNFVTYSEHHAHVMQRVSTIEPCFH